MKKVVGMFGLLCVLGCGEVTPVTEAQKYVEGAAEILRKQPIGDKTGAECTIQDEWVAYHAANATGQFEKMFRYFLEHPDNTRVDTPARAELAKQMCDFQLTYGDYMALVKSLWYTTKCFGPISPWDGIGYTSADIKRTIERINMQLNNDAFYGFMSSGTSYWTPKCQKRLDERRKGVRK